MRLRQADRDGVSGTLEELSRIEPQIREAWGEVELVIRADSGFCREEIMSWCEQEGVDYILGLAQNGRLKEEIASEMARAEEEYQSTGQASRVYKDFSYRTLKSWSHPRRVIGKAEHLEKGANPRFVVTSIPAEKIRLRMGKVLNHYKVCKHFILTIEDGRFSWRRNEESIRAEAGLDGIHVIHTSQPKEELPAGALLDRLTHCCHIFEMKGEFFRFRESMKARSSATAHKRTETGQKTEKP